MTSLRRMKSCRAHRCVSAFIAASFVVCGCAPREDLTAPPPLPGAIRIDVDSRADWTATPFVVAAGNQIEVLATGDVRVAKNGPFGWNGATYSGPHGTYAWRDEDSEGEFPLAAGEAGPAPAFALIGRIGKSGAPFLIGGHRIWRAASTGVLELRINDADLDDNSGRFRVAVKVSSASREGAPRRDSAPQDERAVITEKAAPNPVPDSHVILLFVDGLRYDVLREMAFNGYLPNFKSLFFDGGVDMERTFTIAPANTIPATTACLTGSWPDRTGLFEQVVFHRAQGTLDTLLDTLGPANSARKIRPEWWRTPFPSGAERPLLINEWCDYAKVPFASTVLPVLPDYPPDLYFQRLANVVPLFGAHHLRRTYADRVQTSFALERVVRKENRVMSLWYPGADAAGHESPRGLFGAARRELAWIDEDLAKLRDKVAAEGMADRTYWMLFADHGSIGGNDFISRNYDLANDFFYESIRNSDGDRAPDLDGGLGMNVLFQAHDISVERSHPDLSGSDYAVCATQAYAASWIALPKGSFLSRDWSSPNTIDELTHYPIHPQFDPIDIPQRLLSVTSTEGKAAGIGEHPVELVVVPVEGQRVLVLGREHRAALIERRRVDPATADHATAGTPNPRVFEFRYRPLERWTTKGTEFAFEPTLDVGKDPLGYLGSEAFRTALEENPKWLEEWHDDRTWLAMTADSNYPDAVVAFAHQQLEDPTQPRVEANERYDFFVVASRGWNFATGRVKPAVHHGAPQYEGTHIPFMVSGPNIAKGARVVRPARIIDVLPTLLDIVGITHEDAALDGSAVREIWASPDATPSATSPRAVPLAVDLSPSYPPPDERVEHAALIHDPEEWYDLHNIATDLTGFFLQELVNLFDGPLDTVIPGQERRPISSTIDYLVRSYGKLPENKLRTRPAELFEALRLRHITIGEFINPVQSLQHVDRAVGVVRWGQDVIKDPVRPLGDGALVVYYPIDKVLDGTVWLALQIRDVVERGLIGWIDGSINGIEGGMRACARAFGNGTDPASPRLATSSK